MSQWKLKYWMKKNNTLCRQFSWVCIVIISAALLGFLASFIS